MKRRNGERNVKKSAKFGIFGEQKVRMKWKSKSWEMRQTQGFEGGSKNCRNLRETWFAIGFWRSWQDSNRTCLHFSHSAFTRLQDTSSLTENLEKFLLVYMPHTKQNDTVFCKNWEKWNIFLTRPAILRTVLRLSLLQRAFVLFISKKKIGLSLTRRYY